MRKPNISMKDIAAELGISKNAVSLALGNKPGVSQELRERVFEVASRLGYSLELNRQSEKSRKILILTPDFLVDDALFYTDIYLGIQKQAQVTGHFTMLLSVTPEMIEGNKLPEELFTFDFDGLLIVGVLPLTYLRAIRERRLPLVTIDNYHDDLPLNTVVTANEEGAYALTRHLIDLGHRDIGFVAPVLESASFYERWEGFRKAMLRQGVRINEKFNITNDYPLNVVGKNVEELKSAMDKLERLPTAFVCGNDEIAFSVVKILTQRGLRVPQDVSVTGFDDIDAARHFNPSLTSYRVPRVQLGQEAVRFLLSMIADRKQDHTITKRSLYGALQVRDSTAKRV